MISDETLARAVGEGVITAAQAEGLRALQAAAIPPPPQDAWSAPARQSPDEEGLRFVTGFGDIFVTIGLLLFSGAAGFFLQRFFGAVAMWLGLAASAWLFAEFFTRRRRMALPSIVLLGLFAISVFGAMMAALDGRSLHQLSRPMQGNGLISIGFAGLVTAGMAALHYLRFRIPVTIAAAAAALSATFAGLVSALWLNRGWPNPELLLNGLILFCGLAIFAVAMRFDSSDRARVTRRTDIAFWLHLLAAPLIVHPVIRLFLKGNTSVEPAGAAAILAIVFIFAFVAVLVDRRALLVSGLTYAGIAFGSLLSHSGFTDLTLPTTLLALGAFVLVLSAGWQPLRRIVLLLFPAPVTRCLPPPAV